MGNRFAAIVGILVNSSLLRIVYPVIYNVWPFKTKLIMWKMMITIINKHYNIQKKVIITTMNNFQSIYYYRTFHSKHFFNEHFYFQIFGIFSGILTYLKHMVEPGLEQISKIFSLIEEPKSSNGLR